MAPWLPWLVVALAVVIDAYAISTARRNERAHLREREALINKVMYLAGKTWEPPPGLNNGPDETIEPLPQYAYSTSVLVEEDEEE